MNIIQLLDDALAKDYGTHVTFSSKYGARQARRRLYAAREQAREKGNTLYDSLSFILRDENLLIINRQSLEMKKVQNIAGYRPVSVGDMPNKISSRGKSRVGTFIS